MKKSKRTKKKKDKHCRDSNPRPLYHESRGLSMCNSHCPSGFPIIIGCSGQSFCFKMNGCNKFGENWHFCIFCQNLKCKRSQRFKRRLFAKSCLENIFRPPLNLKPQNKLPQASGSSGLIIEWFQVPGIRPRSRRVSYDRRFEVLVFLTEQDS